VFLHDDTHKAIIVYDENSELSSTLAQAYMHNLPKAVHIDFNKQTPEEIHAQFDTLEASDFVILIQSTSFRLDAFRIRVELFKLKIKVLEHPHLERMTGDEVGHYIDALHYDHKNVREMGKALKEKLDVASEVVVHSGDERLYFPVGFEPTKMNIGDYSQMTNVGGQFPIGEVFTESKELSKVHGRVNVFAFADMSYRMNKPKTPITVIIEEGLVVGCENSTPAFDEILTLVRDTEKVVNVRELGFGLNRGFTKNKMVSDVGSYERMCGVHLSLGAKHGMYAKPGFKRGDGKFHIDIFVDTSTVMLDGEKIFENEAWIA
jgi:leucyl aminopeptidase (aminopeptidase T)